MNDSFTELVERYRRELAQYGRQSSFPASPSEPEPMAPAEPEPAAPPETPPEPMAPAEPEPAAPPETPPGIPPGTEPNNLSNSMMCHPDDTDTATLVVQVYTARQAIPIPEADVSVYCGDGDGNVLISFRTTNADGKTDPLLLSAPNRDFSETPDPPERHTRCV